MSDDFPLDRWPLVKKWREYCIRTNATEMRMGMVEAVNLRQQMEEAEYALERENRRRAFDGMPLVSFVPPYPTPRLIVDDAAPVATTDGEQG